MIPAGILQSDDGAIGDVVINTAQVNLNLKDYFEGLYPPAESGDAIHFVLEVDPTAFDSTAPAMRTGVWAAGVVLTMDFISRDTKGAGGDGGFASGSDGDDGGTAFLAEHPITVNGTGSTLSGGGGGGGGANGPIGEDYPEAGGGGGAGTAGGAGQPSLDYSVGHPSNQFAANGGSTTGGAGATVFRYIGGGPAANSADAGDGGDLGQAGTAGVVGGAGAIVGDGGNAGYSVDGLSNVTWSPSPSLVGPTNP